MNLNNFEQYIEDTILTRGEDYYQSGHVVSLEWDDNEWVAKVSGSEDYCVTVELSKTGEIGETTCDCPYEWGEFCKHQVAVFYELREKGPQLQKIKQPSHPNLKDILNNLDKKTLVALLLDQAAKNRRFKEELLLRFARQSDLLGRAKAVIQASIRDASRGGYVEYGQTRDAVDGADKILRLVDEPPQEESENRVALCLLVMEEMVDLLGYCDDSNGEVGSVIGEALNKINRITQDASMGEETRQRIFDQIISHAANDNGWVDWQMDLLTACVPLCDTTGRRTRLEQMLRAMAEPRGNGWSEQYSAREAQQLLYALLKWFDGAEAAEAYLAAHMENPNFRQAAIGRALEQNQLDRALALCLEGEETDKEYAGLVAQWKQLRYQVYERQGDQEAQRKLAEEFVLSGHFEYFLRLKKLYSAEEWPRMRTELLHVLGDSRQNFGSRKEIYVQILIHEDLKPMLLEYCRQNVSAVPRLYPHLVPQYAKALMPLFQKHIWQMAAEASGRRHYQNICAVLREYKKACGKIAAGALREQLREKYPKRPAFLDELGKLKL